MSSGRCNCPPLVDVMRGRVDGTKPPCPVHPEPEGITYLPRIDARGPFVSYELPEDDDAE